MEDFIGFILIVATIVGVIFGVVFIFQYWPPEAWQYGAVRISAFVLVILAVMANS